MIPLQPPLSQVGLRQRPGRQRTLAAWAAHRAGVPVSHRTSALPPQSCGRVGVGGGGGGRRRVGEARASHLPHSASVTVTPLPAPLSQGPFQQRPERQRALAARASHRADEAVSHRTSAPSASTSRVAG
eukprot:scaffold60449_cov27-Phaeocystis_antarctica.AAC.1